MGTRRRPCALRVTRALAAVLLVGAVAAALAPRAAAQFVECPAGVMSSDATLVVLEPGETAGDLTMGAGWEGAAYFDVAAQVRAASAGSRNLGGALGCTAFCSVPWPP